MSIMHCTLCSAAVDTDYNAEDVMGEYCLECADLLGWQCRKCGEEISAAQHAENTGTPLCTGCLANFLGGN